MKKTTWLVILAVIVVNCSGCASLRKKFVREKATKERPQPVIYLKDYNENVDYDDLYKKHLLFWKYWELELIESLIADNYKKQVSSLNQAIDNLKSLESYLMPDKEVMVRSHRENLEKLGSEIESGFSSSLERLRFKQEIEKHQRILEKELMYEKMKDFIKDEQPQDNKEN